MSRLKYKLLPKGAAEDRVPLNLIFIDSKDVKNAGITNRQACEIVAADFGGPAAIDVVDMDAVTVTSDGIMMDYAVVAFASADYGKVNDIFGFIQISPVEPTEKTFEEEPHLAQWGKLFPGRKLYRGPNAKDKLPRLIQNETETITGRIANNNTGSEMMNVVDMTEVLVLAQGLYEIMKDEQVLIGIPGPAVSVGIGMIVFETFGRIFHRAYRAGQTGHNCGEFAKEIKSDYWTVAGPKELLAKYILNALDIGMVPGRDIGCSPAVLCVAKAYGAKIDIDNIDPRAWVELESIGINKEFLEEKIDILSREEVIKNASEIIPGMDNAKLFNVKDIIDVRIAEC